MAQAYSDDLRCKLLEAYEAGGGSLRELARQFRVSWGYSKKIRAHQVQTGKKERPVQTQHGPLSRVRETAKKELRNWVQKQPDRTLGELREQLQATGVNIRRSRVGQVLQQLGLRLKKSRCTRKSATPRSIAHGGKRSWQNSAGWPRSG